MSISFGDSISTKEFGNDLNGKKLYIGHIKTSRNKATIYRIREKYVTNLPCNKVLKFRQWLQTGLER